MQNYDFFLEHASFWMIFLKKNIFKLEIEHKKSDPHYCESLRERVFGLTNLYALDIEDLVIPEDIQLSVNQHLARSLFVHRQDVDLLR